MTLRDAIDLFMKHGEFERRLSPKTVKAYKTDLRQFEEFVGPVCPSGSVDALHRDVIRDYLQHVVARHRPKTARRKMASLRALLNFLEYEDRITVNPFRKIRVQIKEEHRLPRTIPPHEVTRLLKLAYREKSLSNNSEYARSALTRDIAVMELLFATGMRVAEVAGLTREDVDLERGTLRVLGKGGKERTIPLCCEEVRAAVTEQSRQFKTTCHWFFTNREGNKLSEQSIRFMLRKRARDSGISRHITPHMFRHTVATQLLRHGMDIRNIQHLLGHSSIVTTQIYAHVEDQAHRRELCRRHPRGQMTFSTNAG